MSTLDAGLAGLNLDLPREVRQKLLDYVTLVQKWNKVYNLTAARDTEKMLTHHLMDSLAIVPHVATARILLDIGSGAGLPGIPLALALPECRVTLLDSNHKKAVFLRQALIELKVGNAAVVCERVEKYKPPHLFEWVIARAFSELRAFVELAGRLVAPGGTLLAMKGVNVLDEIARLGADQGHFRLSKVTSLAVPGLDAKRHLVFLKAA